MDMDLALALALALTPITSLRYLFLFRQCLSTEILEPMMASVAVWIVHLQVQRMGPTRLPRIQLLVVVMVVRHVLSQVLLTRNMKSLKADDHRIAEAKGVSTQQ